MSKRKARCTYHGVRVRKHHVGSCSTGRRSREKVPVDHVILCHCEQDSDPKLAFFEAHPDRPHDRFYCGCKGWD